MAPRLDRSTREVLAGFEDIDFHVEVDETSGVILRTRLRFDLHVRPATFIFGKLRETGFIDQLSLRRPGSGTWQAMQPLGMVAQALHKGEQVEIRITEPVTREVLLAVMQAFRRCPLYRDYSSFDRSDVTPAPSIMAANFEDEFESDDGAFSLIRLNIENFIVGHLAEVESYILHNNSCALTDWDCIHTQFKSLLFGDIENLGIMSLDVPLDNLMQTRDMCYHLHFKQLERGSRISYALMNLEWGQENAVTWRRNNMRRHRYFYERESSYYRDLFLVLVLREADRLRRFVDTWADRLEQSLTLRRELPVLMRRLEVEMANFSPNFDNPDEFVSHIRLMGELVIRDLSRLSPYIGLIRNGRVYHTAAPLKVR